MKKAAAGFLALLWVLSLVGCGRMNGVKQEHKVILDTDEIRTYYEMTDGTWQLDGETYQYCLRLSGHLPNAVTGMEYVVLTNDASLDFETVSKSFYSSQSEDIQRIGGSAVVDVLFSLD